MTPERAASFVTRWARLYTRRLAEEDARRRLDELRADLHDHISHERASGTGERRIAASVAARMLRGMAADVSWCRERTRRQQAPEDRMRQTSPIRRSAVRITVVTACLLLVPATLMAVTNGGTDWGVFDFVLAGAIIAAAGTLIELTVRSRGTLAYLLAALAGLLGGAAMVAGEADDAPGLFGFGLLLVLGMATLAARNRLLHHRRGA